MKHILFYTLLFLLASPLAAQNEVTITPMITPPYSPYLYDYEDELILSLINNTNRNLRVKLSGRLENDRGMAAFTKPEFQPSEAIELAPFESRTIFASTESEGFLDRRNIEIVAPADVENNVLRTGLLPEGNYEFCVQALDYDTEVPLSLAAPAGCLFFPLSRLQPPVLINPLCEATLTDDWPVFTWSPPIGNVTGGDFRYDLYLVRLYPGQNMNDAMNRAVDYRAGNPIIIEDLLTNTYAYQPGDQPLERGATYAIQVIARDADERLAFVNNGRSEVCTISLAVEEEDETAGPIRGGNTGGNMSLVEPPSSIFNLPYGMVSGKLLYQYPYPPPRIDLSGMPDEPVFQQNSDVAVQAHVPSSVLEQMEQQSSVFQAQQVDATLASHLVDFGVEDDYSQPFWFGPQVEPNDPLPLAGTRVKLVVRYVLKGVSTDGQFQPYLMIPPGSQLSNTLDPEGGFYENGQTLASAYTDSEGNYQLNFPLIDSLIMLDEDGQYAFISDNGNGQFGNPNPTLTTVNYLSFYRVLRLEVDNPYFASPDLNIILQPNQGVELPDQIALVKAYNLKVKVRSDNTPDQAAGQNKPLGGVMVDIRRDNWPSPTDEIPDTEGQNLDEQVLDIGGYYPLVARIETNAAGEAVFTHLVKHYDYNIGDRYACKGYSKETNTTYAYIPRYFTYPNSVPYPNINPAPMDTPDPFIVSMHDDHPNASGMPLYNSQVAVKTYETSIFMNPDKPVVFGRAMHGTAPLPNTLVRLYQQGTSGPIASMTTLTDGYFRFEDLEPGNGYYLRLTHAGYIPKYYPTVENTGQETTFSLDRGTFHFAKEIDLAPFGQVKGYVVNEAGNPLMADVRIGDGPWVETYWATPPGSWPSALLGGGSTGSSGPYSNWSPTFYGQLASAFITGAQAGIDIPIIIDPHSAQYFPDTFYVTIGLSFGATQDIGTFVLKERLKRPRIQVRNESGQAVIGAMVQLEDLNGFTNRSGRKDFVFPSAGFSFLLRIDPPEGSSLSPYQDYVFIPSTSDWFTINITLPEGATISGTVTAGPNNEPVPNARVFIEDNTSIGEGLPLLETYSATDGSFTLNGIPTQPVQIMQQSLPGVEQTFRIHAVKSDPSVAYVGTSTTVLVPPNGPVNLHMEIIEGVDMSKLLGFPVEIESYTPNGNQATISGAFVDLPANGNFALRMDNFRLPFEDISVQPSSATNAQGTPYLEPVNNEVYLELDAVPLRIYDGFQGEIRPGSSGAALTTYANIGTIKVSKTAPGLGQLDGQVFLELESFKFSYNYTGDFYLGEGPNDVHIPIFKPEEQAYPEQAFHVMDISYFTGQISDLLYSVHEFPAHADRAQSTIQGDTVRLHTILHTNIALTNPDDLAIEAGEIKITPDKILPFHQGEELEFKLEEWTVSAQSGWFYDNINGGLHVSEAIIRTGYVDVPIKDLVIRYDDFNHPEIDLNNPNNPFRLAGVAELTITGSNPELHYDQTTITDLQPHWIIEILSSNGQPAATSNLPHIQQTVNFSRFKLISDGTIDVSVPVQNLRVYDIMDITTTGLVTGTDFFRIQGSGDLQIPGLNADLSTIMEFTRNGGQVQLEIKPLNIQLAGAGKVFFDAYTEANSQVFQNGSFTSYGLITVEDETGQSFELEGRLIRTNSSCVVEIIQVNNQNQHIVCGGNGGNSLEVFSGSMIANLGAMQWNFMEFDAKPVSNKGLAADTKVMHFTIYGAIEASDEEIKMSGFDLGFAKMELTFNITDMTLTGELEIGGDDVPPLTIGVATIESGQFNFLMSDRGFYFIFGGIVNVPVVGDIGACVLVGHYDQVDQVMAETLEQYAYQNAFPAAFSNGFSGFLINGYWEPVNASVDEGLLNFSVNIYLQLGVEVRIAADFQDGYYLFSGLGYGAAGIHISFDLLICDIGIGVDVALEIMAQTEIDDDSFTFTGCASLAMGLIFDACIDTYCWENSVKLTFVMDTDDGVDFDAELGETCSGNDDPLGANQGSGASDGCD